MRSQLGSTTPSVLQKARYGPRSGQGAPVKSRTLALKGALLMAIRSYYALIVTLAAAFIAGCAGWQATAPSGVNAVSGANISSVPQSRSFASPNSAPTIRSITSIRAKQDQKIVIKGTGFGHMKPYNGDSCCIQFVVTNPACYAYSPSHDSDTWQAGYSENGNAVHLNVERWSRRKIVITGFTGYYGYNCWYLASSQPITLNVWNAQTQSGPATWSGTVQ